MHFLTLSLDIVYKRKEITVCSAPYNLLPPLADGAAAAKKHREKRTTMYPTTLIMLLLTPDYIYMHALTHACPWVSSAAHRGTTPRTTSCI